MVRIFLIFQTSNFTAFVRKHSSENSKIRNEVIRSPEVSSLWLISLKLKNLMKAFFRTSRFNGNIFYTHFSQQKVFLVYCAVKDVINIS